MAPRRPCASCEQPVEPGAPYYRFAIALEGEQDVLDTPGAAGDALKAVLAQLEGGPDDATHWDEQVHWERSGLLCATCRARLITFLGGRVTPAPH